MGNVNKNMYRTIALCCSCLLADSCVGGGVFSLPRSHPVENDQNSNTTCNEVLLYAWNENAWIYNQNIFIFKSNFIDALIGVSRESDLVQFFGGEARDFSAHR
jgi:hypothetical protein